MLLMPEVKMICLRVFSAHEFMWGEKKTSIQKPGLFWCCHSDVLYVLQLSFRMFNDTTERVQDVKCADICCAQMNAACYVLTTC